MSVTRRNGNLWDRLWRPSGEVLYIYTYTDDNTWKNWRKVWGVLSMISCICNDHIFIYHCSQKVRNSDFHPMGQNWQFAAFMIPCLQTALVAKDFVLGKIYINEIILSFLYPHGNSSQNPLLQASSSRVLYIDILHLINNKTTFTIFFY